MLSFDLLRTIVAERERDVQEALRTRRLLQVDRPEPDASPAPSPDTDPQVPTAWRVSTPPARATTR
jgi:hypothetical protein